MKVFFGWICPKCKRAWSPEILECKVCNKIIKERKKMDKNKIIALRKKGYTFRTIGDMFNTSGQRIYQIISKDKK